jgi:predicted N-acetyltransferase YhbS
MGLGVEPVLQGQGLGGRLVQSGLERCDRDHLPAYLETAKEDNVRWYQRWGFDVVQTLDVGGGCPPIWSMWRDPQ